jgi:7,8-dihydroneopterin aldolase/epimerase/oxygenase
VTDRIILSRLAVYAHHGVHAEEAKLGQRFYVSVTCAMDLSPAGRSDDYAQALCYGSLTDVVHACATGRRFSLIEALAEAVAAQVLETFPAVTAVTVKVEKPSAPIAHVIEGIAVEIERQRRG